MEESVTYQAIVRKGRELGRAEGVKHTLLLVGEAKFGPPDSATRLAIEALTDLQALDELAVRLINAASWQELVPSPRRRSPRRRSGD